MPEIVTGLGLEGSPLRLRERITGWGEPKVPIVAADISAIAGEIWLTSPPPPSAGLITSGLWLTPSPPTRFGSPFTLDPADVIFSPLRAWPLDTVGCNFDWNVPVEKLPTIPLLSAPKGQGQWVRVELQFTPVDTSVQPFILAWWAGLKFTYFGKS